MEIVKIDENYNKISFNNVTIIINKDNYFDASKLAKQHHKKLNDWLNNKTPNILINTIRNIYKVDAIIDGKYIHPLLASYFGQWISPEVGIIITHIMQELYKHEDLTTKYENTLEELNNLKITCQELDKKYKELEVQKEISDSQYDKYYDKYQKKKKECNEINQINRKYQEQSLKKIK